jgi:hypothetical protein
MCWVYFDSADKLTSSESPEIISWETLTQLRTQTVFRFTSVSRRRWKNFTPISWQPMIACIWKWKHHPFAKKRQAEHSLLHVTITILNIIHRPLFHFKHNFSDTGLRLRFQVEPTRVAPTETIGFCLHLQVLGDRSISVYWTQLSRLRLWTERECTVFTNL